MAIKEFFPKDFCTRNESDNSVIITGSNAELIVRLRKRFMKEAKNIAKLDHPGIVDIHDVFQENGTAYYVMDYIDGDNLSSIVKQTGSLSEEKAIDYIVKVGEALEYMHSRKMTHFDVKPANIIIKKETDTPVLVDFGLSKLYTSNTEETSTLLQAVSSGFSPIELYNGESLTEFSPQSDVYSLGATLYFLLTGKTPPAATDLVSNELLLPSSITVGVRKFISVATLADRKTRPFSIQELCINLPKKISEAELLLEEKIKEKRRIDNLNQHYSNFIDSMAQPFHTVLFTLFFFIYSQASTTIDLMTENNEGLSKVEAMNDCLFLITPIIVAIIPLINYLYIEVVSTNCLPMCTLPLTTILKYFL